MAMLGNVGGEVLTGKKARIIARSGAHGSGKTVAALRHTADMMCSYPSLRIELITGIARKCPLPINKQSTGDGQLWIFCELAKEMMARLKTCDIILCDRSIFDVIAYTVVGAKDLQTASWMLDFVKTNKNLYSQVIYHPANKFEFCHDDGLRETDVHFRYEVDRWLQRFYGEYDISIIEQKP